MQRQYVEAGTTVVAFDRNGAGLVLHREVVPYGARPVTNEGVGLCEASSHE